MPPPSRDWVEVCTIGDLLVRAASLWPEKEWLVLAEDRHTYAGFLTRAENAARSLLGLGVAPGERVGILMPNCMDFLDVQYGCALLGVSAVPINARYKVRELRHILGDAELAGRCYDLLAPCAGQSCGAGSNLASGPVDAYLAMAAAATGETAIATRHAEDAVALVEEWEIPLFGRWFAGLREEHGF